METHHEFGSAGQDHRMWLLGEANYSILKSSDNKSHHCDCDTSLVRSLHPFWIRAVKVGFCHCGPLWMAAQEEPSGQPRCVWYRMMDQRDLPRSDPTGLVWCLYAYEDGRRNTRDNICHTLDRWNNWACVCQPLALHSKLQGWAVWNNDSAAWNSIMALFPLKQTKLLHWAFVGQIGEHAQCSEDLSKMLITEHEVSFLLFNFLQY